MERARHKGGEMACSSAKTIEGSCAGGCCGGARTGHFGLYLKLFTATTGANTREMWRISVTVVTPVPKGLLDQPHAQLQQQSEAVLDEESGS